MMTRSVVRATARTLQDAAALTKPNGRKLTTNTSRFDQKAKLLDESVMEHLVCPISKYPLRYDVERGKLVCDKINVEYPIWHGVPLLVPTEGRIIHSRDNDSDHD